MNAPWLSVVMPTYNGEAYLASALESVVAQGDRDIEVVAIDDGSTDATVSILESFSDRISLTLVRDSHAGNWVANTNRGLLIARGEYACILHQDDLWLANRLRLLKARLVSDPRATLLVHPSWFIDSTGKRLGLWRCPLPQHARAIEPEYMVSRLLVQDFIAMPAPLFRRSVALQVGGLDEDLYQTADWDFWLKLAAAGVSHHLSRPLAAFRIHAQSQTIQRGKSIDEYGSQLHLVLDRHLAIWARYGEETSSIGRMARVSVELNKSLVSLANGQRPELRNLARRILGLGPRDWLPLLHYSRIFDRVVARLRDRKVGPWARAGLRCCLFPLSID